MRRIVEQTRRTAASIPTIRRLPSYLQIVRRYEAEGRNMISGTLIAYELGLEAIQVRKDLAVTGIIGKPRVGYVTGELVSAIEGFLGWNTSCKAIIVGAGNLGSALMGYKELKDHGLSIAAAFDLDPKLQGSRINAISVYPLSNLEEIITENNITMAIVTVPPSEGQNVCDLLVSAGIRQIWNFTNVRFHVPGHVCVVREDLSSGFAVLSVLKGKID